jgi:exopolysaccharide biosynthesis polyprenyl glycosylphosphotransferase
MKRSELFFSAVQVPVDLIMVVLAGVSAFAIRNVPQIIALKPKLYSFAFDDYIKIVLIVAPFFILVYALEGLYNIRATRKFWKEAFKVISATSIGILIVIVTIFLKREWFSSRFIILAGWFLVTAYVVIFRYIMQRIQKWYLINRGVGVHRVLLIGSNGKIDSIKGMIKKNPKLGYKVIGQVETGSIKAIKEIRQQRGIDEIVLCESTLTDEELEKLVDYCAINNIAYKFIPTTLQTSNYEVGVLNGEPIIEIKNTPLDGWGKIAKRVFDLVAAGLAVIILSPILLVTAILVKLESKGPIIYKNERIGSDGKKFYVYKFRYMKWELSIHKNNPDFEKAMAYEKKLISERSVRHGPLYKIKDDPRKTRVGRIIERCSIDELPQLFNVIEGTMSLVGPRPHQEREVEKYREYHRRLLTIKPGITGMAQVAGRSDLDFEDEYRLDLYYIENWSLWLDIQICLKTAGTLLRKRKNL